jgi:cytochrome c oxidase subunit 2
MAGGGYATYDEMVSGMKADGAGEDEIPTLALWKLKTTAPMVVPVDSIVRVLVTSEAGGVLHAFAVPAFGIKSDAVPGTLGEAWFQAREVGTYFGQCSELCGRGHSYMPIEVEVVAKEDFANRLREVEEIANGPSQSDTEFAANTLAE